MSESMAGMDRIVRRRVAGFTLAEILVAVTILTTVLSGVALLFTQSLRTVRVGFQARDAFELARGTISVIERDLARAYGARQRGDASSFYGTPLGFTFIGLVGTRESNDHNLARITYVLHRSVGSNAGSQVLTTDRFEGTGEEIFRATFALLRFVEPGAEDLDSFPVDWSGDFEGVSLLGLIGDPLDPLGGGGAVAEAVNPFDPNESPLCQLDDVPCLEAVESAKKRELWIKMLAGVDDSLPPIWAIMGRDPLDYVLSENMLYLRNVPTFLPTINDAEPVPVLNNTLPRIFSYIRLTTDENGVPFRVQLRFWNDIRNARLAVNQLDDDNDNDQITNDNLDNDSDGFIDEPGEGVDEYDESLLGNPLFPALPQMVNMQFELFFESPSPGAVGFSRIFDHTIDLPSGFQRIVNRT